LAEETPVKCWEYLNCDKTECPAYGSDEHRCWLIPNTFCRDEIKGTYLEKIEACASCEVFKVNMGKDDETLHFIAEQFRSYHNKVLEEHRKAMQELANPVLQVWEGVLVLPLVGVIDSVRAVWMRETLLESVVKTKASVVIIDVTGLHGVDSEAVEELTKTLQAARILGAFCILAGISPEIAHAFSHAGASLHKVSMHSTLKSALKEALEVLHLRIVST
jgi:rsbT co-antagonist protein RsbR